MKVISWKNKPIFTEIILFRTQNTILYGQRHAFDAFDHMEFCVVIHLTMGGTRVTWPSIIATRYVSFATTLNTR